MINYKNYLCMDIETGEVFVVIARDIFHLQWELAKYFDIDKIEVHDILTDAEVRNFWHEFVY